MAAAPTAQAGSVRFEDDGLAVPQPKGEAKQPFVIGEEPMTMYPFYIILYKVLMLIIDVASIHGFCVGAGVGGGTASGKSTVCDMIIQQLHDHRVVLVNQAYHSISFTHLASSTLLSMQINHFSNLRMVHVGAILWVDL
jgi:hypothetical protein